MKYTIDSAAAAIKEHEYLVGKKIRVKDTISVFLVESIGMRSSSWHQDGKSQIDGYDVLLYAQTNISTEINVNFLNRYEIVNEL